MKVSCKINGDKESFDLNVPNGINREDIEESVMEMLRNYANNVYGTGAIVSDIKWS